MIPKSDPKPPRRPVNPDPADDIRRPNRPIEPGGDAEHPIDEPPEEHDRREDDPRSRDTL